MAWLPVPMAKKFEDMITLHDTIEERVGQHDGEGPSLAIRAAAAAGPDACCQSAQRSAWGRELSMPYIPLYTMQVTEGVGVIQHQYVSHALMTSTSTYNLNA